MIRREVFIGLITGIIGVIFGVCACTYIIAISQNSTFDIVLDTYRNGGNFWMLICLGTVVNLGLFFLMLKKNQDYRARGVLLATFIAAFLAYITYFL